MAIADDASAAACLNCAFVLGPARLNYCPMCGQETGLKPPTLREFAQQFGGSYIAVEGALWRSLKLLLLRPGTLTREYLDGRRRRYVLPLRLYLTISVIALLLLRTLTIVDIGNAESAMAETGKPPRVVTVGVGFGKAEVREGVFTCTGLPQWMCKRLEKRLTISPKLLLRELNQVAERVLANAGTAMFVLLPAFALWLRLVYRNRGLNYTEHLVFALHVHAFWFVMLGLVLVDWNWLTVAACAAVPIYLVLAMHRVYAGRWWPLLVRAAVVGLLYLVMTVPTMLLLSYWAILF